MHVTRFSLRSLFVGITLATGGIAGAYVFHRHMLWTSEPFCDPNAPWFIGGRQHLHDTFTPLIAMFTVAALFGGWYAIHNRHDFCSLAGGLCLTFPLFIYFGLLALATLIAPLATPIIGIQLIRNRRFMLGCCVITMAVLWLWFLFAYLDEWFAVFGD